MEEGSGTRPSDVWKALVMALTDPAIIPNAESRTSLLEAARDIFDMSNEYIAHNHEVHPSDPRVPLGMKIAHAALQCFWKYPAI